MTALETIEQVKPCAPDIEKRFGRSPTFQLVDGCKCIDLVIENGRISTRGQIMHHVLMRLGIKGKALDGDNVVSCFKGGWWADFLQKNGYGNRLWTIEGVPFNDDNVQTIRNMIKECLNDLVDLNIINDIRVNISKNAENGLVSIDDLMITKPDGGVLTLTFEWLWD